MDNKENISCLECDESDVVSPLKECSDILGLELQKIYEKLETLGTAILHIHLRISELERRVDKRIDELEHRNG
jgi:hypothetical protein